MWNRLASFVLGLLYMWNHLAAYVLRLLGRHDPSPGPENEVGGNINLCYQMVDEEADSGTATGGDYDVFLSFRGPDTRDGFTDCLYEFMCGAGIRVYRDKEELEPGEKISEILRAVKSSQIYVPIFSKGYALSGWCLKELACMVESTRQSPGKKILPIFYDVDPLDVKLRTRLYESALNKHEERYGCTRVKPWKDALTTVGEIRGWLAKDQRHGKVMTDITQKVLQKLTIRKRHLPTNLVGIDDRIEDIKKLLDCPDTSDVRFVIIHGIGGIGKTTLVKAVFNQLSPRFEGHSFLSNIQDSSPYGGIIKMQRKLVADLFSFPLAETSDFEDGNNYIRARLPNKQVLLVFDGMDENDQFMQLAKHCTSCGLGSRIIITTRDKSVFPVTKVEGLEENVSTGSAKKFLYEMKEMHLDHALQLLNKIAFNTDSAPRDLYDLSREVVELTGGLPLAVEVIGSDLRNQTKAKWKSTLKKLKKVPHQEVQQKLKISYDGLEYGAKQIFLDISCFFVNKKISSAKYMWEACNLFPEVEIDVLIKKSLIKIVDRDRITMHDQLRDLGRAIVREENIGKPGGRSRLGFLETALDIVRARKGTANVVALSLWRSIHNFTREDCANLMNVRFLELDGGNFAGNFEDILSELRWLCWRNCPPTLRANNFVLNHLVVLKLSSDINIEEWRGWVEIMEASKLKVLKIAGSKSFIKTPCFSEFMSLERLVLKDFPRLTQIDHSIGKLERLVYLKIKWCPRLTGLPEQIGCLTALRELILIQCFSVRYLPDSIGNLRLLSRLAMEDTELVGLPDTIKGLADLEYLCLANCTRLKSLSDAVGELESLTELDLSGTTIKELPHSIWNLEELTLRINSSTIRTQLITDLPLLEGVEDCLDPLRLKDKAEFERAPKKLNEVSLIKVRQKLILSYEALEYGAKQIFLDIAFFFDNKEKTDAVYMWEARDLFPKVEIDVLVNKSLIKIIDHDRIWMHDQVRYFGREIVRQDNAEKPQHQSRLWFLNMVLHRVRAEKGTENEIAFALWISRHNFTCEELLNFFNTRFLELDGRNFAGNLEDISPGLRWLCWQYFPSKLQANNFVLNRLVVLKLSGDIIVEEWSGWVEIMVASKLKVLKIARSKSLIKTPCFSEFMSLERLVLEDFPRLTQIDHSIGKLEQLIYLKIKWCPRLTGLPEQIGCLTALRELILNCASLNSLPAAVGELKLLTELDLSGTTIKELPSSLWNHKDLTLQINNSKISTQLMKDLPLLVLRTLEDEADSESALKEWNEVSLEKVRQKLLLRYEALRYGAKQIFLDIACFFVNKKITDAVYMWEACDLFPKVEIEVLVNESLMKIVDRDRIWMHDLIRNFGRDIVRQENIKKLEDRCRLWLPDMALDIVQAKKGTENVVALMLRKSRHNFTREEFANLVNVRFLELDGGNFAGNFENILPELTWLCWRNCPPKLQASNFVLNHLVVLKLSGDITIEEWTKWVEIMVASKLKILNLAGSKSLIKTPCFSEFMSLERLILKDFPSLAKIDGSIGKLEKLIYLKIKCCPCLGELPKEIGCLTALRELILIQGYSVRYLPDSIGNLRLLSRLVMEDTGLVELPDTIKGLVDLEYLCLANCTSLNSLSADVGELKSLIELDLSGTTIEELPPSLWNLEILTLLINGSKIQKQLMRYGLVMQDIENCLDPQRILEPDDRFKGAIFSVKLLDYPMEILIQEWRTIVAPGFHKHHLSGMCPPKILARVIFPHGSDRSISIAVEVPLWDAGIMSSSETILCFKNLIVMLVSWLERKWVSKWMHDFQRKDEELLSLEFCDHCMSITSEIREFSDSPLLESSYRIPQLSIAGSISLNEPGHSDQIGCRVENLEILTKFSSPILRSTNLLLKSPWSREKLRDYIELWNSWHEEATQVEGSASRRSFKSRKSHRRRKTHGGRLRAKRKRNLTWLCLHHYLDKHLLIPTVCLLVYCCILSPLIKTKLDYCEYVLEKARLLLDSALDVKRKTRLAREFTRVTKGLGGVMDIEILPEEDCSQLCDDMCNLLLHWCRGDMRRGRHHHKTFDADFFEVTKC